MFAVCVRALMVPGRGERDLGTTTGAARDGVASRSARSISRSTLVPVASPKHRQFPGLAPHVVTFDSPILIGSLESITIDRATFRERAAAAEFRAWLGDEQAEMVRAEMESCRPYDRAELAGVEPNHDLFPRDEFDSTRYIWWRLSAHLGLTRDTSE